MKDKLETWILKNISSLALHKSVVSLSQCCSGRYYQIPLSASLKQQIYKKAASKKLHLKCKP